MADAQGSGPCERNLMQVQVLSSAPTLNSLNFFVIKRMFGLFCFIEEFEKFRK